MTEESDLRFEDAVRQIEAIVESLEGGEPELAAALAGYETGVRLLAHCYGLLERAERSVALLTGVDEEGRPATVPFDATATMDKNASSGSDTGGATADTGKQTPKSRQGSERPKRTRSSVNREREVDSLEPPF